MSISDKTIEENDLLVALMLHGWQLRNTGPAGRYCEKEGWIYRFRIFEHGNSWYRFLMYDARTDYMVFDGKFKLRSGREKKCADIFELVVGMISEEKGGK